MANLGALKIRLGFWVYDTITVRRNPHSSIGNYLGPYATCTQLTVGWVQAT